MPAPLKIKRTLNPGAIPVDLEVGELAVNLVDRILYIGLPEGQLEAIPLPSLPSQEAPKRLSSATAFFLSS